MFIATCVFSSNAIAQSVTNTIPQQKSGNVENYPIVDDAVAPIDLNHIFNENISYADVEEKPTFQGGDMNDFSNWVKKKLVYPASAAKDKIQGKVFVEFVIDKSGRVKNVKVFRKAHPDLDAEAVSVIKSSPAWTPGKMKNKLVDVFVILPVTFKLE
jgi:protein TonB